MATIDIEDRRLVWLSWDRLRDKPKFAGTYQVVCNEFWLTHPERGVLFWRSHSGSHLAPQCNLSERVTKSIGRQLFPWAQVQQLEAVVLTMGGEFID